MLFTTVFVIVKFLIVSGFDDVNDYMDMQRHYGFQNGFPVLPPPRTTRQTPGYVCVPIGTCATNTNGIDPRIVTPGVTPLCGIGLVACYGNAGGLQCGQRSVTAVSTADGTATLGAYPWQAYMLNQTGYTGSGVLIDQYHVLTAAHKVNLNSGSPGNIRVYMGVYDPITSLVTAQQFTVARMIIHPSFDATTLKNDIAVLRLSAPVTLGQTNVNTACLPTAAATYVGQSCSVSGWGKTGFTLNDAPTSPQKQVTVPIVSMATCRTSMAMPDVLGTNVDTYLDQAGEICAGGVANVDACTQDGGSPLICSDPSTGRFTIAGLVIWGKNCGRPNVYGVYVNVPFYRSWIDSSISTLTAG